MEAKLDQQFGVTAAGSTVSTELRAGMTTFLTMAYILLFSMQMRRVGSPFPHNLQGK